MDTTTVLTPEQVAEAGLTDWHHTGDALAATYQTGDFATGLRFLNRIGDVAEAANHHPDVTLTYPSVHIVLTSHDVGGTTSRDVDLAGRISAFATELGIPATEH